MSDPSKLRRGERDLPAPERRQRRALSHVGGPIELRGDPEQARLLEHALSVEADEAATRAHVHGFHSWAARLHPATARALIEGLTQRGGAVLDPFCGSGTVPVEARLLGRRALGLDANPLGVELAWLKTRGWSESERAGLLAAAGAVAEHAEERRIAKAGPTRRYGPEDRELFDVHVLLELDGLSDGIRRCAAGDVARALDLALSSILVKVSRQPGDTVTRRAPRRLAGGFTTRLFVERSEELAGRLATFSALLPPDAAPARLVCGDARRLGLPPRSVDLVLSSPPYPGVYDYAEQHAARLRWLRLPIRRLEQSEIGARRRYRRLDFDEALAAWEHELRPCLAQMAEVLRPRGAVALVVGDTALAGRPLFADREIERIARRAGLRVLAAASQRRPHFHAPSARAFARAPRREHLLLLAPRA